MERRCMGNKGKRAGAGDIKGKKSGVRGWTVESKGIMRRDWEKGI